MSFLIGILTAIGIVSTIGFVTLLTMYFGNSGEAKNSPLAQNKNINAAAPAQAGGAPAANPGIRLAAVTEDDHIRGDKNAKISIVEFSDIQCPFCQRFHPTMQQVIDEYEGEVNWVYRHFPLESIHPEARPAAIATECMAEQRGNEAFWTYLDSLFVNQATLGRNTYERLAQDMGANMQEFKNCLDTDKYDQKVSDHLQQAAAAGARGTPYSVLVVDGQTIPLSGALPFAQIKSAIDSAL